jgi:predicted RNA binding protein YcfA (HicA-like mRNA interferase family)
MPDALPSQLEGRRFCAVLSKRGYVIHKEGPGSSRTFLNSSGNPKVVTFHEPHNPATLAKGTLREYVRKLKLSREQFLSLLD